MGGLGRGGSGGAPSLLPLIILSALVALLLSQNSVILAYPAFQSPVQSPAPTEAPPEAEPVPPEGEPTPPEAPPEVLPTETVGEETTPSIAPEEATVEDPETETPPPDEKASSTTGGMSSAVLIDTCVVGLSTVWLCCGGLTLVIFMLLVIASFLLRVT